MIIIMIFTFPIHCIYHEYPKLVLKHDYGLTMGCSCKTDFKDRSLYQRGILCFPKSLIVTGLPKLKAVSLYLLVVGERYTQRLTFAPNYLMDFGFVFVSNPDAVLI